ncbi:MAG TPA: hypothetical protein ENI88_02235 [Desulfobulbus sp.]|nr:hypothetical protein [Desulfobulbus sp.]
MTSVDNKRDDLWGIQVSIAKAIAKLPRPSLAQLHHEILEEIGQRPGLDLVDYFVGIAEISKDEVGEYFQRIGASIKEKAKKEDNAKKEDKDPQFVLADTIASGHAPTVLKFRQAFKEKYDEYPSAELTTYFLKRLRKGPRNDAVTIDKQGMLRFAEKVVAGPSPTVLKFRQEFSRKYGCTPPGEVTQFFLKKIQEKRSVRGDDEEYKSKVNFAETVASGLNLTVVQFRQAYAKVYDEAPSTDIIDIFIKSLPRKGEAPRSS